MPGENPVTYEGAFREKKKNKWKLAVKEELNWVQRHNALI